MENPYTPLLRQFKARLPRELYLKIDRMWVTDAWTLRVTWAGYPEPPTLLIPLAGTKLDYDALCAYIALHAP